MKTHSTSRSGQLNVPSRLSKPNEELLEMYGDLSQLIGTWSGNKGMNLIAVPVRRDNILSFELIVAPYYETLIVTPLTNPISIPGIETIENVPTLMYSLMIQNAKDNSLMHAENGIWQLLDRSSNNGFNLSRMALIPHGNAVLALGNSFKKDGKPDIDTGEGASSMPFSEDPLPFIIGYTDPYTTPNEEDKKIGYERKTPNVYLSNQLEAQEKNGKKVKSTTSLILNTQNVKNITNIPSINKNAVATIFSCSFWLETVEDSNTGQSFQQLQYSQRTDIDFPVDGSEPGTTITWPHINVNTLIKQ